MKRALALAPALLVLGYGLWTGPKYDRFVLPAFDGFVYDAMADHPQVFTLAPWGYRILGPWIVHLLPVSSAAVGFFWMNLACLSATLLVVGFWLRRLGFSSAAAAIAAFAFALAPPLRTLIEYEVLVDPPALLILAAILLELLAPRALVLAALFTAGALTKEVCLLPLFMAPLVLIQRSGWKRGALETLAVATPAVGLALFLRASWGEARPVLPAPLLQVVVDRIQQSGGLLAAVASLSGLSVVALVGLVRERSVSLRIQGAVMWALTLAAAIVNPYQFSIPDLTRLSVFAWPALLPLALSGLGFARAVEPERTARLPRLAATASVLTLLICVSLVLLTDPFRRAPERDASPNPITFLARFRESLKTAGALEAGETFTFDARSGRFAAPVRERFNLTEGRQQRWFLYSGFGPEAAFGSGAPEFRGDAEVLLPVFVPRTATLSVELEGPEGAQVEVSVAGRSIDPAPADGSSTTLVIPRDALIRGDNIVRLRGPDRVAVRVLRWEVRLERSGR